jgi:hypothetical protein
MHVPSFYQYILLAVGMTLRISRQPAGMLLLFRRPVLSRSVASAHQ